jgi:ATP-dependent Clp protease ATP-binding subunit ClpB
VKLQFANIRKMMESNNVKMSITDKAIDWIANAGFDPQFGARPIKRIMQKYILNELSKHVLANDINKDKEIRIDCDQNGLSFKN